MAVSDPDDGILDFVEDPTPRRMKKQTVVAPPPVYDPAHPPVLSYQSARNEKGPPADIEEIKNQHLPLVLLVAGVAMQLMWAMIFSHHLLMDVLGLLADLTVGSAIMLGAMLLAARMRGLDLGNLRVVAYKMAALSVAPQGIGLLVSPLISLLPMGFIGVWILQFVLFFALLGAMFDLEEGDIWFCVWTIFATRLAFYALLSLILGRR